MGAQKILKGTSDTQSLNLPPRIMESVLEEWILIEMVLIEMDAYLDLRMGQGEASDWESVANDSDCVLRLSEDKGTAQSQV